MVDYVPASPQTKSIFTQFQNGTALDTSTLVASQNLSGVMSSLSSTMGNVPSLASSSSSLATFASVPMNDLTNHLTDQNANLPQNLQLATSQISNALGMGTGNPNAACQSAGLGGMASMFGSVMGMAKNLIGSAQGHTSSAAGLVAGKVGAGVINHVLTNPSPQVVAALGPFADISALETAMANPTAENLQAIGWAITHLSTLSPSVLGSAVGADGTTSNLAALGSSISALSAPSASGGGGGASPLSSVMGAVSSLNSAVSSFVPGGLSTIMNGLAGGNLAGAAQSMVSAISGNIGSLGGVMNNITNMISGEKGALGAATKALVSAAAAYNLPLLNNNACAAAVLNAAGSQGLKDALNGGPTGSTGPTSSDQPTVDSAPDGTDATIPTPLTNAPLDSFQSGTLDSAGIYTGGPSIATENIPAFASGLSDSQIATTPLSGDSTPSQAGVPVDGSSTSPSSTTFQPFPSSYGALPSDTSFPATSPMPGSAPAPSDTTFQPFPKK